MFFSAIFVFIFTKLGSEHITAFKMVSFILGLFVGYSGHWGAYYTELFPQKFSALAPGISYNGGRIILTFVLPAIAALADTSVGINGIFNVSSIVFIAGAIFWAFLPETLSAKAFIKLQKKL